MQIDIRQLLAYPGKAIPPPLDRLYHACVAKNSRPNSSQLAELFQDVLEQFSSVYLVFDAFDECDTKERSSIVESIRKLAGVSNTKLLVTSRPHEDFLQASGLISARTLEIRAHEHDVQRYISIELENVQHFLSKGIRNRISESLQNNIHETCVEYLV